MAEEIQVQSSFSVYQAWNELGAEIQNLLQAAKDISTKAYAPYSKFSVGAAVLLENGVVVTGSNQENAAFPSGLCAERVALFSAHSTYPNVRVTHLVIYATGQDKPLTEPVTPCGACRQVISEYEDLAGAKIKVYMANNTKVIEAKGIDTLLPLRFQLFN